METTAQEANTMNNTDTQPESGTDEWFDLMEAQAEHEAEFAMNWVMGGGSTADIGAAYDQHHRID